MPQYHVSLIYSASESITVEAEDRESAVDLAQQQSEAGLCHQCANHLDLGDPYDEVVTDALTGREIPPGE
jgi:hypothetical protein